jgi:hypothetical protein
MITLIKAAESKREQVMDLVAKRVGLIDTGNAFKIGPLIRAVEEQGKDERFDPLSDVFAVRTSGGNHGSEVLW